MSQVFASEAHSALRLCSTRLQRAATEEGAGWGATGRVRGAPEFARELRRKVIEYSLQRRTLDQTATETGITSLCEYLTFHATPSSGLLFPNTVATKLALRQPDPVLPTPFSLLPVAPAVAEQAEDAEAEQRKSGRFGNCCSCLLCHR